MLCYDPTSYLGIMDLGNPEACLGTQGGPRGVQIQKPEGRGGIFQKIIKKLPSWSDKHTILGSKRERDSLLLPLKDLLLGVPWGLWIGVGLYAESAVVDPEATLPPDFLVAAVEEGETELPLETGTTTSVELDDDEDVGTTACGCCWVTPVAAVLSSEEVEVSVAVALRSEEVCEPVFAPMTVRAYPVMVAVFPLAGRLLTNPESVPLLPPTPLLTILWVVRKLPMALPEVPTWWWWWCWSPTEKRNEKSDFFQRAGWAGWRDASRRRTND